MSLLASRFEKLTSREWSVVRMLAAGVVPARIAQTLSISVKTVSQHVNNIERKVGVDNRLFLQKMLIAIKIDSVRRDR